MEKRLYLPNIKIVELGSLLEKNGQNLAQCVEGLLLEHVSNPQFTLRQRGKGILPLIENSAIEGLVMITKGDILGKKTTRKIPKGYFLSTYLSFTDSYLFFPELIDLVNSDADDFDEELYDEVSKPIFANYGTEGFGIGPFESYMAVDTGSGAFLLNETIFEDRCEELLPGEEVYLHIEEGVLLSNRILSNP